LLNPLVIFFLVFFQHFLVHGNLKVECLFDAISFFLQLVKSILENAVHGFCLPELIGTFLELLESGDILKKDIVCQFAWRIAQIGIGCLTILLWREILKS
jgi:hypothetical protein